MRRRASIPKQQGDDALKAHVANVCFKYFRCFIGTLQVFHMDIAKVDQDVAYSIRPKISDVFLLSDILFNRLSYSIFV
jgi:hypothetical protein